jgi:hypothetical protein
VRCTSVDLPAVTEISHRKIAAAGLSDRVSARSLDFFAEPLPKADVITMGMIRSQRTQSRTVVLQVRTPEGFRAVDVLMKAHGLRVERSDHHITDEHVADAIEALPATRPRSRSYFESYPE